jgi:hypothetical protein
MFKLTVRKVAFVLFLTLLASPVIPAFASGTGPTSRPSKTLTAGQSADPNGITGTDPEPIDPGIVILIISLLHLA